MPRQIYGALSQIVAWSKDFFVKRLSRIDIKMERILYPVIPTQGSSFLAEEACVVERNFHGHVASMTIY